MRNHKGQRNRYRSGYKNNRRNGKNGSNIYITNPIQLIKNGNFRPNQNPSRMIERYTSLAKEALSSGDKILSENYFQHADHFLRMVESRSHNIETNLDTNKKEDINKDLGTEEKEQTISEKIQKTEDQ